LKALVRKILPRPFWEKLIDLKKRFVWRARRWPESFDIVVSRKSDYYSPLPSQFDLARTESRWKKPSALSGVKYDLDAQRRFLLEIRDKYYDEFSKLAPYEENRRIGFGPGFSEVDAFTLHGMMRSLKPKRYLEVGSGLSTYYCSLAREFNEKEGATTKITCIEPYPYAKLSTIPGIELVQALVQDVPLDKFRELGAGDILFIDSSHILRLDGDVPYLFLEVLPQLAPGVHVQIHDIPFPYNFAYPSDFWVLLKHPQSPTWPMYWNEAMLLQAFLAFNSEFEITVCCPMLRHFDEAFLARELPFYPAVQNDPAGSCGSIWIKRR
jgi:hypothetical protein